MVCSRKRIDNLNKAKDSTILVKIKRKIKPVQNNAFFCKFPENQTGFNSNTTLKMVDFSKQSGLFIKKKKLAI